MGENRSSLLARLLRTSIVVILALPVPALSQDRLLRLACEGTQETARQDGSVVKERKFATITVNSATGAAQFQNFPLIAFNMTNEPVTCSVTPAQISCGKDYESKDKAMKVSSNVLINRYSGLLTESQITIITGGSGAITIVTGEFKCQLLSKPIF